MHEVRRPNVGEPTDAVFINISKGAVAVGITGPLRLKGAPGQGYSPAGYWGQVRW